MSKYYFSLNIAAAEYLRYYQGGASRVVVRTHDGRSLSLPAAKLRPFVDKDGVHGRFCLIVSADNRFIALERWNAGTVTT